VDRVAAGDVVWDCDGLGDPERLPVEDWLLVRAWLPVGLDVCDGVDRSEPLLLCDWLGVAESDGLRLAVQLNEGVREADCVSDADCEGVGAGEALDERDWETVCVALGLPNCDWLVVLLWDGVRDGEAVAVGVAAGDGVLVPLPLSDWVAV
jgi:hypothetical protein